MSKYVSSRNPYRSSMKRWSEAQNDSSATATPANSSRSTLHASAHISAPDRPRYPGCLLPIVAMYASL